MGVDHNLTIYGNGGTRICDFAHPIKSPVHHHQRRQRSRTPTTCIPMTGNVVPPLTDGLVDNAQINTDDGNLLFCGRLRRPDLTNANLTETDPEGCDHWQNNPGAGAGDHGSRRADQRPPRLVLDEARVPCSSSIRGRRPTRRRSTASSWATGDAKLNCFLRSYRFDYGGSNSKGHTPQTEFFIDPSTAHRPEHQRMARSSPSSRPS